jgi:hypothetical protein
MIRHKDTYAGQVSISQNFKGLALIVGNKNVLMRSNYKSET